MIWLTWRQFRTQAATMYAAVAAFAVVLAITGPKVLDSYHADRHTFLPDLNSSALDRALYALGLALYAVPPNIGAFWGAPMIARELEAGTHQLIWTQSITRNRWLATKLALTGVAALALTGVLTLAISWWSSPIDRAIAGGEDKIGPFTATRLAPAVFGIRGVVPIGYTAVAFTLGVAAGLVLRRTLPAIAVTLAAVVALQVLMPIAVRPHLIAPLHKAVVIRADDLAGFQGRPPTDGSGPVIERIFLRPDRPGDWVLSGVTIDANGHAVRPLPSWVDGCAPGPGAGAGGQVAASGSSRACFARLASEGYRQLITYQPASRFWALQWLETAVLAALALLLTGFSFWRIRRLT